MLDSDHGLHNTHQEEQENVNLAVKIEIKSI